MIVTEEALESLTEEELTELYKRARAAVASGALGFNRTGDEC